MDETANNNKNENTKSQEVKALTLKLAESSLVVVPTDKTNSFSTMDVSKYKEEVEKHLTLRAVEIPRDKLTEIQDQCFERLEELEGIISEHEFWFLKEKIKSKAIPQPKILIKDHKMKDGNGDFPTRLVVPATNFTLASLNLDTWVSRGFSKKITWNTDNATSSKPWTSRQHSRNST